MVQYTRRISIFKVNETWFRYQFHFWDIFTLNSFLHIKDYTGKIPAVKDISHTLELDLEQGIDKIEADFSKQIRQQVKIAKTEGTTCYFHRDIEQYVAFFDEFAQSKGIASTSRNKILELGESLKLSFASNNGQILAAHSYLIDKEMGIVRHYHSATKRLDESVDKNLVGRANKYLTVNDILYFKEKGLKIFDFGGYAKDTEDKSLQGINNYKLLFGGKVVPCLDYYSYLYWTFRKISKLLGLRGKL